MVTFTHLIDLLLKFFLMFEDVSNKVIGTVCD